MVCVRIVKSPKGHIQQHVIAWVRLTEFGGSIFSGPSPLKHLGWITTEGLPFSPVSIHAEYGFFWWHCGARCNARACGCRQFVVSVRLPLILSLSAEINNKA